MRGRGVRAERIALSFDFSQKKSESRKRENEIRDREKRENSPQLKVGYLKKKGISEFCYSLKREREPDKT